LRRPSHASVQVELQYLTELDIDFEVTVTGFELPEIDLLIGELLNADENVRQTPLLRFNLARQLPPGRHLANRQPSSDLRRFDNGRNVIGLAWRTARSAGIHRSVLQRADLRPCWRLGVIQHREFAMASGQMSQAEFTAFLQSI